MRSLLALSALGLLFTACTSTTSDAALRRQLVGAWVSDANPHKVVENQPDGSMVVRTDGYETALGTWQVQDGYFLIGPAASAKGNQAQLESNKVVSVSGGRAIFMSPDGKTELTFHRE